MPGENNPLRYHQLAAPTSREDFQARCEAFCDELMALRIKHGIPDLHFIVRADVILEGDLADAPQVVPVMTGGHMGNSQLAEAMCAWAFGRAGADRAREMDSMKAMGIRSGLRSKGD